MIRRTPLKRSTKPIRKRRPGPPRRGPANIPPERWRNPGYLRFLREEGRCTVCMIAAHKAMMHLDLVVLRQCDPAHGPVNGTRSKGPDAEAIPLCRSHHAEMEGLRWPAFEVKYGFLREDEAKVWFAAYTIWKEHNG